MSRLVRFFAWMPRRAARIGGHFKGGLRWGNPLVWWTDLLFLLVDLLGIFDLYDGLASLVKTRTVRPLDERERQLARSVFGNTIDLNQVRIDERARIACRRGHLAYVSFHTINSWGGLSDSTLIHELVHVWQHTHRGAAYIPRALRAMHSAAGYNYGGIAELLRARGRNETLHDFNYEQQADIIADAFRLRHGLPPRWGKGTPADLPVYELFVGDLF